MTDSPAPKWRTVAYRDSLLLHLHHRGLTSARRAIPDDLAGRSRTMHDSGVIDGLPAFAVTVHRQQQMDLASSLDAARALASSTGKEHAATVHYRRGHSGDDPGASYVVMTLDDFASLQLALTHHMTIQSNNPNDASATALVG